MPDKDKDGAEDSGEQMTEPGAGTRDAGQAFDGGRQGERMRDFPGLEQPSSSETPRL